MGNQNTGNDFLERLMTNPVCPDSGEPMTEITDLVDELSSNFEVWESPESGSLFIRTNREIGETHSDYNDEELLDVREFTRNLIG